MNTDLREKPPHLRTLFGASEIMGGPDQPGHDELYGFSGFARPP